MSLRRVVNIADLRLAAKKRLPKMVFDYIDGGADDEQTLRQNTSAFRKIGLTQNVLTDVSSLKTDVTVMGGNSALPFVIAPTATSRLFNPRHGERAVARAAHKAGIPYSISTLGSVRFDEVTDIHTGPKWLQLYVWKDHKLVEQILQGAKQAGFTGLILTVDTPVAGNRERDPRNQFSIPPSINLRSAFYGAMAPGYMFDMATTSRIGPANVSAPDGLSIIDFINTQFDPSVTWDYVKWLRTVWDGPIAIKGISKPEDAARAVDAGVNCVWISNHGGRQLDTAPPTIDLLPEIHAAVDGAAQIILDSGIRRGSDIVKALALGADAVAIGRAYLYGLAAAGEAGVDKAIDILATEMRRTMALIGVPDVKDLDRRILWFMEDLD